METSRRSLRFLASALVAVAAFALTGCAGGSDPLADQFRAGSGKNYIAGDGTVSEYASASRGESVAWAGVTESGDTIASTQLTGVPTVINFWYAGCAPCRAEAKDLQSLSEEFAEKGVQFIGVNVRDTAATSAAFGRNFGITYPSIIDAGTGEVVLAFTGVVSPQAVPTTLVIDRKGRVASRILGRIEKGTLKALIDTVVTEK